MENSKEQQIKEIESELDFVRRQRHNYKNNFFYFGDNKKIYKQKMYKFRNRIRYLTVKLKKLKGE